MSRLVFTNSDLNCYYQADALINKESIRHLTTIENRRSNALNLNEPPAPDPYCPAPI